MSLRSEIIQFERKHADVATRRNRYGVGVMHVTHQGAGDRRSAVVQATLIGTATGPTATPTKAYVVGM